MIDIISTASMSLLLRNLQKVVPLNFERLTRDINIIRRILKIENYDLAVLCVDDNEIQLLNDKYRNVARATDVLAFPAYDDIIAGQLPFTEEEVSDLGDIVLGIPYINRYCQQNEPLTDTLPIVVTHGICHLLGYNHLDNKQSQQVQDSKTTRPRDVNDILT
ncbi:endoribonuclease YbeY-like isoform X2 [Glandiceps talaboti]